MEQMTTLTSIYDQSCSNEDVPEKIFSNPLFEEEIISTKIDPHHFDAESDLLESMLNRDSSIISSSSKIDSLLDEFVGELTLLKSIPPGIDETDCYRKNDIRFTERLLYDNSSPRPPEEFVSDNSDADIESFSPSPIPVEDIESQLLDNYSLSLPVNESFHFDIPSFSRPFAKPPDGDTGILNIKMMDDISDQKVPIPRLMIILVSNKEKYPDLLPHRGLEIFQLFTECPMMIHGKNIPILDVPLFHFYPLINSINTSACCVLFCFVETRLFVLLGFVVQYSRKLEDSCQRILSSKSSFPQLQLGIIPWVRPVHRVPKKGGMTVIKNDENKLVPTRLVTDWRVYIDYRKLNKATRKDHFPLPFMDQMLERLEKSHFMVREGIVLGHKISKKGIEVDKAKIEVIPKLPHPTTVKGIRSFLGHAGFIVDLLRISRRDQDP
nr:retrovirus-related Pol polyprotein [Tanacetum cinerariifolium]